MLISGSRRLETNSGFTRPKGVEAGSNMPVACCVSERRAEEGADSHRRVVGIGRIISNGVVILLNSGSRKLETNSSFTRPKGAEAGSNVPVARCVSERESGAAPPVAETASRFQGSVPMAEPPGWGRALADTTRAAGATN